MKRIDSTPRQGTPRALVPAFALLVLLLVACGSDPGDPQVDTTAEGSSQSTPSTSPSGTPEPDASTSGSSESTDQSTPSPGNGTVDFDEVALLHGSAEGGQTSTSPTVLDSAVAVDDFVAQFSRGSLADEVRSTVAATQVPEGQTLIGTVIAIGCNVPPGVTVRENEGLIVSPTKVINPLKECLVAVTTVALLLVESDVMN